MSKLEMIGEVVTKTDRTLNVQITKYKEVAVYGKKIKYNKKYLANNPTNAFNVGDTVTIRECPPVSKRKRFEVVVN